MGAIKILSANDVKRIAGISGKQYKKVQWHSAEIIVRPFLTIDEYIEVIKQIMRDCRDPDGNIVPELIDFAIRINIICAYASIELPEDMKDCYYIIYASDLYETILSSISKCQVKSIIISSISNIILEVLDERKI